MTYLTQRILQNRILRSQLLRLASTALVLIALQSTCPRNSLAQTNTFPSTGNVGIGTTTPGSRLEIYENQNAVIRLIGLNNPSSGTLAQATFSFYEGSTEKAKFAVNSSGTTGYLGGPNALQIFNFLNASVIVGTNSFERMRIAADGNVGIGTTNPGAKLEVLGNISVIGTGAGAGNITAVGTITGGTINAKYQDVAEWVPATNALPVGTVVTLDPTKSNHVEASSKAYDTRVAGVISEQPGITLGERGDNKVLVATTGRVRLKVDASNGPIQIGDLLVTSDIPGVAMESEAINVGGVQIHRPGTLIGKALEPLARGSGEILVLLSLQ